MKHIVARWKARYVASALAFLLGACGGLPPIAGPSENAVVQQATELPPPAPRDLILTGNAYLVGPLDKLTVTVFGVPELSTDVQADAAGDINLPLIGSASVTGKSPTQIAAELTTRYRAAHVREPVVTVTLRESTNQTVTVDGQVKEPGVYPVVPNMSLTKAIASAKGADEFAKLEDVVVFRVVDGKRMAALYNVGAIRRGVYDDPRIYPNDLVVVGESRARRLFKDVLQAAPAIVGPIVLLLQ